MGIKQGVSGIVGQVNRVVATEFWSGAYAIGHGAGAGQRFRCFSINVGLDEAVTVELVWS